MACRSNDERPFSCNDCGKAFKTKQCLSWHFFTHNPDKKPFPCAECPVRCVTSSDLRKHMRTHTGEKPFTCDDCGKKFKTKQLLSKHRFIHNPDRKPFPCTQCPIRCMSARDLRRHMRTHTGEKPFSCDLCTYRCSQSGTLKAHHRTHLGKRITEHHDAGSKSESTSGSQTDERQLFKCDVCCHVFRTEIQLVCHVSRRHHHANNEQTVNTSEKSDSVQLVDHSDAGPSSMTNSERFDDDSEKRGRESQVAGGTQTTAAISENSFDQPQSEEEKAEGRDDVTEHPNHQPVPNETDQDADSTQRCTSSPDVVFVREIPARSRSAADSVQPRTSAVVDDQTDEFIALPATARNDFNLTLANKTQILVKCEVITDINGRIGLHYFVSRA